MARQIAVHDSSGPVAGAPYTPAVRAGDFLYVSGQLGLDPQTKKPYADFAQQVEGSLAGLTQLLTAAGGSLENVVKTTVFLADLGQFTALNEIYGKHFGSLEVKPARSTFQVAALPLGADVEIEAVAYLPDAK